VGFVQVVCPCCDNNCVKVLKAYKLFPVDSHKVQSTVCIVVDVVIILDVLSCFVCW